MTKSLFSLPWALTLSGLQHLTRAAAPSAASEARGSATASLDDVSASLEQDLEHWLDDVLDAGERVWRVAGDVLISRRPTFDGSGLMRMAAAVPSASLFDATTDYGLTPAAHVDVLSLPEDHREAALQEYRNRVRALRAVLRMREDLGLDPEDRRPVTELVAAVESAAIDIRAAALEAVGALVGDRAVKDAEGDPQDVLTCDAALQAPASSLLLLHAGLGRAFADAVLRKLTPAASPDLVRHAVSRFSALCRRSSRRGFVTASQEALGFVAELWHADLVPALDREVTRAAPELRSPFWHGVGRARYLDPLELLPSRHERRSLPSDLRLAALDDAAYGEAVSGLGWALVDANLGHPAVLERVLRDRAMPTAWRPAFVNGILSAVVVHHVSNPDDPRIHRFINHEATGADGAAQWRTMIAEPCRRAIDETYAELQRTSTVGHLFQCGPTAGRGQTT